MAARDSSTPLTKTLSVRLERDPAIESLLLQAATPQNDDQVGDKNSSSSDCFICGRSGLRNSEDLQLHRDETEYFKSILINPQLRSRMSSKAYAKFLGNLTTCITCLAVINQVWALHRKMAAIQLDLDELVEEARQKTVKAISQDIDKGQKVASSTSSIPVKQEITAWTGKEAKKSQMVSAPKIEADDVEAAEDFNNGIKKEEDSKDVKLKLDESEDDEDITDHDHQHCRNEIHLRQQILSRRLTLRSLINVRRCGGRNVEKLGDKIRNKTGSTTSSKPRKTKIKPSITRELRKINTKGERLSCSKCGKLYKCVSFRLHHELQVCKIHFTTKELEKWKDFIHKCTICGHFFGGNAALQRHIQAHKGRKPFSCPNCKERFTQKGNMKRHYKTMTVQNNQQIQD